MIKNYNIYIGDDKKMKVMVISDIHGGVKYLKKAIEIFNKEKAERLLILGDFTGYYGSSSSMEVAEILNEMADKITAVRGNCDSLSFEEMLNFRLEDIRYINVNNKVVTLTHGHLYNRYRQPEYVGDIFLNGHIHYGTIVKENGIIFANPGSITKPRNGSEHSFLIIDDKKIVLKNLDGDILQEENIEE